MPKTITQREVETLEWWTCREVGNLLRFDASTVRRWCESGKIEAAQMPGGTWRIHESVVKQIQKDGLPEKRRIETAKVPAGFENVTDYFPGE